MKNYIARTLLVAAVACVLPMEGMQAQQGAALTQEQRDQRWQMEKELESIAVIERKVMMPMRDGVRLATDIYRPKNASGKVPIIWVRTPYNFNFWDVRNGVPADMKNVLTAVQRGYAYVIQNERGHFFSPHNRLLATDANEGPKVLHTVAILETRTACGLGRSTRCRCESSVARTTRPIAAFVTRWNNARA